MAKRLAWLVVPIMLGACSTPNMLPATSNAPTHIRVVGYVPYASGAASEDAQKECTFQTKLPIEIKERARSEGFEVTLDDSADPIASQIELPLLTIETVATNAHGGGRWTGDKWARIRGKLVKGQQLIGSFEIYESVGAGGYSTCGTLDELAEDLSKRVTEFLTHPRPGYEAGF